LKCLFSVRCFGESTVNDSKAVATNDGIESISCGSIGCRRRHSSRYNISRTCRAARRVCSVTEHRRWNLRRRSCDNALTGKLRSFMFVGENWHEWGFVTTRQRSLTGSEVAFFRNVPTEPCCAKQQILRWAWCLHILYEQIRDFRWYISEISCQSSLDGYTCNTIDTNVYVKCWRRLRVIGLATAMDNWKFSLGWYQVTLRWVPQLNFICLRSTYP
jgi:hypothetical protein